MGRFVKGGVTMVGAKGTVAVFTPVNILNGNFDGVWKILVSAVMRRFRVREEVAEEIVAAVVAKTWDKSIRFASWEEAVGYLIQAAFNLLRDEFRAARNRRGDLPDLVDTAPTPEANTIAFGGRPPP